MSAKSDLFAKAFAGRKAKLPRLDRFAEGGMAEEKPTEIESSEGGDTSVFPDEKLAAYEILEVMKGTGDAQAGAERLAKALKSFFLIVDSQPHDEGGTMTGMDEGAI